MCFFTDYFLGYETSTTIPSNTHESKWRPLWLESAFQRKPLKAVRHLMKLESISSSRVTWN